MLVHQILEEDEKKLEKRTDLLRRRRFAEALARKTKKCLGAFESRRLRERGEIKREKSRGTKTPIHAVWSRGNEATSEGLSLKYQDLTAIFLAVRLYCSFVMEYDMHTILDLATLGTTLSSAFDPHVWQLQLCWSIHRPHTTYYTGFSGHCVYEAVSVLPQLRVMQNPKIVEPFTAHDVFALGVARFLSCAHWVLQVVDTRGRLLVALGYGLWPSMVLISRDCSNFHLG
ncbi:unnamed protein product [Microthlaspi erraticum]|uniref:Uncharacterized protein n=1 Tax=Microthlaspi erraticum TaxID=1685480 RepID=A0A6D2IJQ2_9BRAS|nr:unnamed protein product [Microthlaspi erraticum]